MENKIAATEQDAVPFEVSSEQLQNIEPIDVDAQSWMPGGLSQAMVGYFYLFPHF